MKSRFAHLVAATKHFFKNFDRNFDYALTYARHNWQQVIVWGAGGGLILGGLMLLWAASLELPDLQSLQTRRIEQSVKIFDRTGTVLLYDLNQNARRTIVPLSAVSPNIQQATLAIEDPDFYTHRGIKITAIIRAIITNLMQQELLTGQGGSTITQQVVKGAILTNDKTITRKIKEWVLALKMERVLSKDQIFELYLNQIPYGGTLYGAEETAMAFYGKHASDVTLPEAAYMAAVLPAPTRLSPYGTHLDQLEVRKNLVLEKMYEHGYITEAERDEAKTAVVEFVPPKDTSIAAPHFVFYVRQYLEEKYGEEALSQGGWRVITTLDADLQVKAEEIVQKNALANVANFNATNMAMTAVDPKTGQILVMVGSRNYFDTEIPGAYNVAVSSPGRQPGSAFKPFAYAQAFSEGYTPDTVVFDVRTQFSTSCSPTDFTMGGGCYSPQNYDGDFRGPMSLRNALAQSINVPAVKVLYLAGISDTMRLAKAMGIKTLADPDRYGLTLVLGGGEVTLLDMTSAYGTFANQGYRYEPIPVLKVEDANGKVIEDNLERTGSQVLEAHVAQQVNDVLSDVAAAQPLGLNNFRNFGQDVALKTGTTNDYRDAWIIGYTPNLAVGLWAGNNDNTPMERRTGGAIVAPAWSEFMHYAVTKTPVDAFARGAYSQPEKPILRGIWQVPGSDGSLHEILYWVNKNDPTGPAPANPWSDSQFEYWDLPVRAWAAAGGLNNLPTIDTTPTQPPPTQFSPSGGSVIPQ